MNQRLFAAVLLAAYAPLLAEERPRRVVRSHCRDHSSGFQLREKRKEKQNGYFQTDAGHRMQDFKCKKMRNRKDKSRRRG